MTKSSCWNCKHFVYLDKGMCTRFAFFEDKNGDDSCGYWIIANELKNGGRFVLKEDGFRHFEK